MESTKSRRKTCKVLTFLGSMFLSFPCGITWFWGNLSVYALSFVVCRLDTSSQVELPWLISLYYLSWSATTIANSFISRFLSKLWIILLGSALANVAMFLSYFAIKQSLALLNFTLGLLGGFSAGLLFGPTVELVVESAAEDVGFLTSAFQSSYSFGAILMTQLITWYINPSNESPNLQLGSTLYFTQADIIDKVPSLFVVLGVFTLALQVIGLSLLQINPSVNLFKCTNYRRIREGKCCYSSQYDSLTDDGTVPDTEKEVNRSSKDSLNLSRPSQDYTPMEMVKTAAFLALWISFALADFPFLLLVNYYKLFGQLWIHDDHFLTNLGVGLLFVSFLARVPWGLAMDRFGAKRCMMVLLVSMVITVSWYYFTPKVSRWLYFAATLIYGSFSGALYSCYLAVTALVFGKTHVATNYGLVISSAMAFNVVAPYLIKAILAHFGWFITFAEAGGLNVISLVLLALFVS